MDGTPFQYSGYLGPDSDPASRYVAHLHGFSQSVPLNAISYTLVSNYPIILIKITILSDVIDISENSAAPKTAFLNLAIAIDSTISLFCAFHNAANSHDCTASVVDAYGPLVES